MKDIKTQMGADLNLTQFGCLLPRKIKIIQHFKYKIKYESIRKCKKKKKHNNYKFNFIDQ